MQIRIAPAADETTIDLIRRCLEEAGHMVTVGFSAVVASPGNSTEAMRASSAEAAAMLVAVVDSDIDPASVGQLWTELTKAERQSLPALAVITSDSDVPPAVAAVPHKGEWIHVQPTKDPSCAELLGAVTAVSHGLDAKAHSDAGRASVLAKVRSSAERIRHLLPQPDSEEAAEDQTASRRQVFVAYSREDSVVVDDICSRLDREGYDVWRDTTSIPGGTQWRDKIGEAISKADFVLVLLSSNVTKKPRYPKIELGIADTNQKTIIPVLLENIPLPPKGFEYILEPLECIDLYRNHEDGIHHLLVALGQDHGNRKPGVRERARDVLTEARSAARRNELGKKAKTAAVVGLGAAAAAFATAYAAQKEKQFRDEAAAKEQLAQRERAYRDEAIGLLSRILKEIELAQGMTPMAYREEFRPRVNFVLGQLKATQPPNPDVAVAHAKVVDALAEVIGEFDEAINKQERGDSAAWTRALERLNLSWATGLKSSIDWLVQITGPSGDSLHDSSGADPGSADGTTG